MATLGATFLLQIRLDGLCIASKICHAKKSSLAQLKIQSNVGQIINLCVTRKIPKVLGFMDGCPFDKGKEKPTLRYTLIDYYDTTNEKLRLYGHVPGPKCRCNECDHLKSIEDRWIMRIGSLYGISGLNTRDEMKGKQF